MRKIALIIFFVFFFFLIEFFIFNMLNHWLMPNLSLLLVAFMTLYFGIRHGLFTAILAGMLQDSFGISMFGVNLFSFVVCAYMTVILRKYVYHLGAYAARLVLVAFISVINVAIHFVLYLTFGVVHIGQTFQYIFLPEVLTTLLVSPFVFQELKKCASRLYVS